MSQQETYKTASEKYGNPEARIQVLEERLKFIYEVADLVEMPGFHKLVAHLRSIVNKKNRERNSLDPKDYKSLMAHGRRALFFTGYIQGAEYVLNDLEAAMRDRPILEKELKELKEAAKKDEE